MPRKYTRKIRPHEEVQEEGEAEVDAPASEPSPVCRFLLSGAVLLHPGLGYPGRYCVPYPTGGVLVTSDIDVIKALRRAGYVARE